LGATPGPFGQGSIVMEAESQVWSLIGVVITRAGIATVLILHAMASLGERVGKADTHGRVAWAIRQLDPPGAGGRPPSMPMQWQRSVGPDQQCRAARSGIEWSERRLVCETHRRT
jgi:hypothetical protein